MTRRERPVIYPDPDPTSDRLGLVVRAVCGLLLGVVLGFLVWARGRLDIGPGLIVMAVSAVACAFGSARWGDDFWYAVLRRRG
jgi:hypothetical protein